MGKAVDQPQSMPEDSPDSARPTDEKLLAEYRQHGDRQAFAQLVSRYERELFSYLRRYLGDAEMAEDAFQATFLQVHLKCDQFEEGRRFRPWLYTIATNQAIDAQRRNKRHRNLSLDRSPKGEGHDEVGSLADLLVSRELNPESRLDASQRRDWIRDALDQLPEQFRTAVQLIYYQGLKYREAADILGIPVGTVKSRLHTAILKLNQMWMETQSTQPNQ
jgi:RNA polymerase sigma-70 factor, ECF subfamily